VNEVSRGQLERLERRVERLTSVLIIQSLLLGAFILPEMLEWTAYMVLLLVIAIPLLIIYRREIPAAFQWASRLGRRIRRRAGAVPNRSEDTST
jgi:hypothetical protein